MIVWLIYLSPNTMHIMQAQAILKFNSIKGLGTKKVKIRKQNPPKMPKKIKNSFLKRAQIPYDYNIGLQIREFDVNFHKNNLKEGTFKNQNLT